MVDAGVDGADADEVGGQDQGGGAVLVGGRGQGAGGVGGAAPFPVGGDVGAFAAGGFAVQGVGVVAVDPGPVGQVAVGVEAFDRGQCRVGAEQGSGDGGGGVGIEAGAASPEEADLPPGDPPGVQGGDDLGLHAGGGAGHGDQVVGFFLGHSQRSA